MTQVYEGIRILDFTQLEQGPAATQILADFGAEVIKIERINVGEIGRQHEPRVNGMSPHWAANNRNKLSLSVDVKHPEGKRIVLELVKTADIVASNFRPGVMERLGLGYEDLRKINPRIICAYASGYGQSGPYRNRRGQDLAAQALGGVMALTGEAGGPPTPIGTFAIDYLAAMHFAMGMMLALAARERTGRGQIVDCSLLNAAVAMHLQEGTTYLNTGRLYPRPPHGVAHAHNTALYARYRTAEGAWLVLIAEFYIDQPWRRVCRALDLPEQVVNDSRFQTIEGLLQYVEETYQILSDGFLKFQRDEALKRLEEQDVLAAPVYEYPEVFTDPQVLHNEMVLEAEVETVGKVRMIGNPIKLSETPAVLRTPPPTVGQHNEVILRSLGYSDVEIRRLQDMGIVGAENCRARNGGAPAW
ncbi:MAG: CoA transferase [Alicyclobacillus sp.]|nr:CoA transferase [Alicyclobacillus sp.]